MEAVGPHQFWGLSPAVDVFEVAHAAFGPPSEAKADAEPLNVLLLQPADIRHQLKTIAQRFRHTDRPIHFYVFEKPIETLARQFLLLQIATDWKIPLRLRANVFLEVFGNATVQDRTSKYISAKRMELIDLLCNGRGNLKNVFDPKFLKYAARDELEKVFKSWDYRVEYDVDTLRDQRLRHHTGTRYDFRGNLLDWDHTMGIKPHAGNVHIKQYKIWRETGVAFEFGDQTYNTPNRSLASYALGRDRKHGSHLRRGFWGDTLCSPYHALGTACYAPDPAAKELFSVTNRNQGGEQWRHTAVDMAVYNVLAALFEIETGEVYRMRVKHELYSGLGDKAVLDAAEREEQRKSALFEAKKDLETAVTRKANAESAIKSAKAALERLQEAHKMGDGESKGLETSTDVDADQMKALADAREVITNAEAEKVAAQEALQLAEAAKKAAQDVVDAGDKGPSFGKGAGESKGGESEPKGDGDAKSESDAAAAKPAGDAKPEDAKPEDVKPKVAKPGEGSKDRSREALAMQQKAQALARARCIVRYLNGFKIYPLSGEVSDMFNKKRFQGIFDVVVVSALSVHNMAKPEFESFLRPKAAIVTELARNVPSLKEDQIAMFEQKVRGMAGRLGCRFKTTIREITKDTHSEGSNIMKLTRLKKEGKSIDSIPPVPQQLVFVYEADKAAARKATQAAIDAKAKEREEAEQKARDEAEARKDTSAAEDKPSA